MAKNLEGILLEINIEEAFKIVDLDSLNWVFRKLSAAKEKEYEIKDLAFNEMQRIKVWQEAELKKVGGDTEYFKGLIQEYHQQQLLNDPKAKTLSTPYGKSKSRATGASIETVDEKKLLEYVITNDLQYIKKSLDWLEFKKSLQIVNDNAVNELGEIVDGVHVNPARTSFSLDVI